MTGRQRIEQLFRGERTDRPPVMPIVHSALAPIAGVPMGRYFTDAGAMADVVETGHRRFGFDGVQLTLGVVAEPEAFGARVEQPPEGGPLLKQHLLGEDCTLDALRAIDPATRGRLPMYHAAVAEVVRRIGAEAFVISTLRGPLNMASQLRGVEDLLIDMLKRPEVVERVLDFTTDVAARIAQASLEAGAHGVMFGEATCSPNFISPKMYRALVLPRHRRLMESVRAMGWKVAGLHVCGGILPILDDLISTGATLLDVDYQVAAQEAIARNAGRVVLRGNLNPTQLFLQGTPAQVREATLAVRRASEGSRWILSSGCDIPPGTSPANLEAFVAAARA